MPSFPAVHTLAVSPQPNLTFPPIPDYSSDLEWVTAYLVQRMLSHASWAYPYLLWFIIAAAFILFTLCRWAGLKQSFVGALWSKWALRRRTWRKRHALAVAIKLRKPHTQPSSLPPNAHLLAVVLLWIGAILISFVGPDYMAPGSYFWTLQEYPTLGKRGYDLDDFYYLQPKFTIDKMWYTTGGRTGLIAFALFPLTVLFALKTAPFAIFAIPQFAHLCFDKLAFLHRWTAFLVWFLTTLHVIFWCIQLGIDHKDGYNGFHFAWSYTKFRYAWTAYISFTILMVSSLPVVRRRHYETFYFLHVLFVPLTLIFSALHHPPVWWWCWAALALWVGERSYRLIWWLNTNGYLGGLEVVNYQKSRKAQSLPPHYDPETLPMHSLGQPKGLGRLPILPRINPNMTAPVHHAISITGSTYIPPPGFIHAELLPGKTVRVRMVTPGFLSWAPGQHFLINIPYISKLTSHPFTVASVCDQKAASAAGRELVFFIRAKKGWTKKLWDTVARLQAHGLKYPTGDYKPPVDCQMPPRGVLLRAFVDGPFGSAARGRWNEHSTVLLVAGGSGVSFALSVLEYMCMCMAGRDGRDLGGQPGGWGRPNFKTQRVRFVWLVREFGHIHWCASFLRRCMDMVPPNELQIDIFVTNTKPSVRAPLPHPESETQRHDEIMEVPISPRTPHVSKDGSLTPKSEKAQVPQPVIVPVESEESEEGNEVDLSYYTSEIVEGERAELGHEEHALDLTNFEGDDDTELPGEDLLNVAVKAEGQVRRSIWGRSSTALTAIGSKQELGLRSPHQHHGSAGFRSSAFSMNERPSSVAMMSLTPLAGARLSRVQLASPLSTASPNNAVPLLGKAQEFTFPPTITTAIPVPPSPRLSHSSGSDSPRPLSAVSAVSDWSGDAHSLAALVSETAAREEIRLELDDEEIIDISVLAERARAGRPTLNKILADEVAQAKGSIIVGCCGPTSLSAVMRKNIAAQIDPSKVRHGDMRGYIDLISEDFEY